MPGELHPPPALLPKWNLGASGAKGAEKRQEKCRPPSDPCQNSLYSLGEATDPSWLQERGLGKI